MTRREDCVARLGGDEFVVVVSQVRDPAALHVLKRRLLDYLERPVLFEGASLLPRMSVGQAIFFEDGETAQQLLGTADRTMYIDKRMRADTHEPAFPPLEKRPAPRP